MVTKQEASSLLDEARQAGLTFRCRDDGYLNWTHALRDGLRSALVATANNLSVVAIIAAWVAALLMSSSLPILCVPPLIAATFGIAYAWFRRPTKENREGRVRLIGNVAYSDRPLDSSSLWDHSVMRRVIARKNIRDRRPVWYYASHALFFLPWLHTVRAEIEYRVTGQQMVDWREQDGKVPKWMLVELAGRLCGAPTLWVEAPWRRERALRTLMVVADAISSDRLSADDGALSSWRSAIRDGRDPRRRLAS